MRKRRRNIVAILIFFCVFSFLQMTEPSANSKLLKMYEQLDNLPHNNHYYVEWEEEGVRLRLPVEHFLVGALAASILGECEKEVMKAQAIMLRSSIMKEYEDSAIVNNGQKEIYLNQETGVYWTDQDMQHKWGERYEEYLEKCLSAVTETNGIYLTYKGKAIHGFYTGMSAGGTRDSSEMEDEEKYGYLKKAFCVENLSAEDYVKEYKFKQKNVGELGDRKENKDGYVLSLLKDGERISGEQLRAELGLASVNFTWEEVGDSYVFRSNGKGHGFGLDQYYGNVLAKKGEDYSEILNYFFTNVTYQRME